VDSTDTPRDLPGEGGLQIPAAGADLGVSDVAKYGEGREVEGCSVSRCWPLSSSQFGPLTEWPVVRCTTCEQGGTLFI